jgi:hypothetical protein
MVIEPTGAARGAAGGYIALLMLEMVNDVMLPLVATMALVEIFAVEIVPVDSVLVDKLLIIAVLAVVVPEDINMLDTFSVLTGPFVTFRTPSILFTPPFRTRSGPFDTSNIPFMTCNLPFVTVIPPLALIVDTFRVEGKPPPVIICPFMVLILMLLKVPDTELTFDVMTEP